MRESRPEVGEILRHVPRAFYGAIRDIEERWAVMLALLTLLGVTGASFTRWVPESWRPWIAALGLAGIAAWAVLVSAADLVRSAGSDARDASSALARQRAKNSRYKRQARDYIARKLSEREEVISAQMSELDELRSIELVPALEPVLQERLSMRSYGVTNCRTYRIRITNQGKGSAESVRVKLLDINGHLSGGEEGKYRLPEYVCEEYVIVGGEHIVFAVIAVSDEPVVFLGQSHFAGGELWDWFLRGAFRFAKLRITCTNDGIEPIDCVINADPPSLAICGAPE